MHKITRLGLDAVQKIGLDHLMVRVSGSKLAKDLIFRYGWHHESYDHCKKRYRYLKTRLEKSGEDISFKGKSVLEIGSGNSIGLGYFLFNEGYSDWTASDHGRSPNESPKIANLEYEFAKKISDESGQKVLKYITLNDGDIDFEDRLRFSDIDITSHDPELDNRFDIILSIAVLEHVPKEDMELAIANMVLYLKPGGIMFHAVDLKDHVNPLNPFGFYKYDHQAWDKLTRDTIFYTNRLRPKDYVELFGKHGLSVLYFERENPGTLPPRIDDFFVDNYTKEDLQTCEVVLIVEKK